MNYLQKLIDDTNYWDSRVIKLDIRYFGDEVYLKSQSGEYTFLGCYDLDIKHFPDYDKGKPPRLWEIKNIPYTIHDMTIKNTDERNNVKYVVEITMPPMFLNLSCNEIKVIKNEVE